ncbi:hypothetical protein D3C72_1398740 [compost metagenome]
MVLAGGTAQSRVPALLLRARALAALHVDRACAPGSAVVLRAAGAGRVHAVAWRVAGDGPHCQASHRDHHGRPDHRGDRPGTVPARADVRPVGIVDLRLFQPVRLEAARLHPAGVPGAGDPRRRRAGANRRAGVAHAALGDAGARRARAAGKSRGGDARFQQHTEPALSRLRRVGGDGVCPRLRRHARRAVAAAPARAHGKHHGLRAGHAAGIHRCPARP